MGKVIKNILCWKLNKFNKVKTKKQKTKTLLKYKQQGKIFLVNEGQSSLIRCSQHYLSILRQLGKYT